MRPSVEHGRSAEPDGDVQAPVWSWPEAARTRLRRSTMAVTITASTVIVSMIVAGVWHALAPGPGDVRMCREGAHRGTWSPYPVARRPHGP
jgi:hypothetical protein